jgi:hypothetical protein
MMPIAIATQPTPVNAPAVIPQVALVPGPPRNIARFSAIISEKTSDQPNIRALLNDCTSASVKLFARIQALPKSRGEYQSPPKTKVETAAAKTAK